MQNCKILVKGIIKCDNQYLVVAKWYDDCIMDPYQWQFIDGEADFGEAPDAAVIRHIQEQVGLTADITKILYTWSFMQGDTQKVGIAYECIVSNDQIILSEELNDAKWITKEEVFDYIKNESVIQDLQKIEL